MYMFLCIYVHISIYIYADVHKKWVAAAENWPNENFYQCDMNEPATKPRVLFITVFYQSMHQVRWR